MAFFGRGNKFYSLSSLFVRTMHEYILYFLKMKKKTYFLYFVYFLKWLAVSEDWLKMYLCPKMYFCTKRVSKMIVPPKELEPFRPTMTSLTESFNTSKHTPLYKNDLKWERNFQSFLQSVLVKAYCHCDRSWNKIIRKMALNRIESIRYDRSQTISLKIAAFITLCALISCWFT